MSRCQLGIHAKDVSRRDNVINLATINVIQASLSVFLLYLQPLVALTLCVLSPLTTVR